jgi:hypothetical protein
VPLEAVLDGTDPGLVALAAVDLNLHLATDQLPGHGTYRINARRDKATDIRIENRIEKKPITL